jgi:ribosome biogenesis protein Nip4
MQQQWKIDYEVVDDDDDSMADWGWLTATHVDIYNVYQLRITQVNRPNNSIVSFSWYFHIDGDTAALDTVTNSLDIFTYIGSIRVYIIYRERMQFAYERLLCIYK